MRADFSRLSAQDIWNHWVYSNVIDFLGVTDVDNVHYEQKAYINPEKQSFKTVVRETVKAMGRWGLSKTSHLSKNNEYFFFNTYMSWYTQWRLELALGGWPTLNRKLELGSISIDLDERKKLLTDFTIENDFESFLISMIKKQIPASYIEGYRDIVQVTTTRDWPNIPKAIITGVGYFFDEYFKVWTAKNIEQGSQLIIVQHGGNYGTNKWSAHEEHQYKIGTFFSWGWTNPQFPNIIPLPSERLFSIKNKLRANHRGGLLQVLLNVPRYSYHLHSTLVASQLGRYDDEQIQFVEALDPEIFKSLTIRPYPEDYGWDHERWWTDRIPDIRIADKSLHIHALISQSRLVIGTYNSTTILETLAANIPTVIFWNPAFWEMNAPAQLDYDELREVGILHDTPESAAAQINLIWDDVLSWWMRPHNQEIRGKFCSKYARTSLDWMNEWKLYIQNNDLNQLEKKTIPQHVAD